MLVLAEMSSWWWGIRLGSRVESRVVVNVGCHGVGVDHVRRLGVVDG